MQRLFRRSTPIILSGLLALFGAAACGDDDGGGDGASDSPGDDDGSDGADDDDGSDGADDDDGGEPDADVPVVVRRGTVAITETNVSNLGDTVSGGIVSISYVDLESVTVAPVKGLENGVGGCEVVRYDVAAGDAEPTLVDEGPISVTGTANGDVACAFSGGEYRCQSLDADSAGGTAVGADIDGGSPTSTVLVQGSVLNTAAVVGSQLVLTGFGDELIDNIPFPVVARPAASTFAIATPVELADAVGPKGSTYATFVGAGPIPNPGGAYNFISDKSEVAVTAEASASGLVPAFSGTYTPEAEGFELVSDPDAGNFLPHEIPTAAAGVVNFACAAEGCGVEGAGGNTGAMIINGRTTDGELPPADQDPAGIAMPDPVGNYATFTCAFPAADVATISAEAMTAILGTAPTRIQTTVLRAQATLNATAGSETAETRVIIGHSQTGFTTVAPKAPPKLARPRN